METTESSLIDYDEVLKDLGRTAPQNHLLLGNGFNLSLGINTSYPNILKVMKKNNREYETVFHENFNLEEFIGQCKSVIPKEGNPYWEFMTRYFHNKVKLDFMKAVTEIVATEIRNIYQEKNEGIYLLIKHFGSFFTLNYDPFLYQLLMTYKKDNNEQALVFQDSLPGIEMYMDDESREIFDVIKRAHESGVLSINVSEQTRRLDLGKLSKTDFRKEVTLYLKERYPAKEINRAVEVFWRTKNAENPKVIENLDDGFGLFGSDLTFSSSRTQNLFFLHGAFHLYRRGESIHKITQESDKALYEKIEEIVESQVLELVCVLSDSGKVEEIVNNEYLRSCLSRLAQLEGTMVIIGSSLATNDSHIFDQINRSRLQTVYISSSVNTESKDLEKATQVFPNKRVVLFDRETITYLRATE